MSIDKILANIENVQVELNKDLTKYSTMKLESHADLITVETVEALKAVLKKLTENGVEFLMLLFYFFSFANPLVRLLA